MSWKLGSARCTMASTDTWPTYAEIRRAILAGGTKEMPSNSVFSCGYPSGSPFCESCPVEGEFCPNTVLDLKWTRDDLEACPACGRL